MRLTPVATALALSMSLHACDRRESPLDRPPPPPQAMSPSPSSSSSPAGAVPSSSSSGTVPARAVADDWIGQWTGPEGTLLVLTKLGEGYDVKIQSLDGPNVYSGRAVGEGIAFERDGKVETLRAGLGADTGMKWLAEKKDCLVVRPGEGFCRD